jgi:hypothetical protein
MANVTNSLRNLTILGLLGSAISIHFVFCSKDKILTEIISFFLTHAEIISSFLLALLFVSGLTYLFAFILTRTGLLDSDLQGIIRESDWYPSLSRVQFLSWTFIIGIVFVWFFFLKVWYAYLYSVEIDTTKLTIPENLLLLMGITSLTMIASKGLSSFKYVKRKKPAKLEPLGTMFQENERPSLTRYQIFIWTSIGVLTYFGLVLATIISYSRFS